jgi:acyl carrier protein phosphodiesterase
MNVLGHLVLAGQDTDLRTGQFLGDFCRGSVDRLPYRPGVLQGMRAHRTVDAAGEIHPFVRQAKQHLPPESRRYGGIVIDVLTDWLLHENWQQLLPGDKSETLTSLEGFLSSPEHDWPAPAHRFAGFLTTHGVLHAYAHLSEIRYALGRLGMRLRRHVDLAALLDPLLRHEHWLHASFPGYFHDMQQSAAAKTTSAP